MANGWLTNVLILFPFGAALLVWLFPLPRRWVGAAALVASAIEIGFWIVALVRFDFGAGPVDVQFQTRETWFRDLGVSYHVGLTGFALWLIGLTVIVMAAAVAYAYWADRERPRAYFGLMLFLTASIVGVFCAQDLLLFYAFWEAMLIPLYILIGVWGGPGRYGATVKFVIYTMAGSLLMLASIVVFGLSRGTFDLVERPPGNTSMWVFLGFAAAFAVKAPVFPLHGWLPDAYRESPAEISAVLSGVVSKAAAYGFFYIAILNFPNRTADIRLAVLTLAAIGLVYGSLLAFRAPDVRGVIAYSSLAQLSLIVIGLFATNLAGWNGAFLQMVNHGLISATLFLLAGTIERRTQTGRFDRLGGMARGRPALATLLLTAGVIGLAVPGSTAFAGEFAILVGIFTVGWGWAVVGVIAIVLAAMYMLRLVSAVLHRDPGPSVTDSVRDLEPAELAILVPLVACLIFLSAWPASLTDRIFPGTKDTPGLAAIIK